MLKRLLDVVLAAVGLAVTGPAHAVIAAAIRVDSPGPVLFRQVRVGRWGKPFVILKYRTMVVDHGGALVSPSGDPRTTRVGRYLRRSKLDELPQLVNVLRGDMSLVGPRPEVPRYAALWPEQDRDVILSVRPGITDPVSLELLDEASLLATAPDPEAFYREVLLPRKAAMYVSYVRNRSGWTDAVILLRSVQALSPWARTRRLT